MIPIIFKVSLNAVGCEKWLNEHLLRALKIPSLLIMENLPILTKKGY